MPKFIERSGNDENEEENISGNPEDMQIDWENTDIGDTIRDKIIERWAGMPRADLAEIKKDTELFYETYLYEIIKNIAEFVEHNKLDDIVLIDRSARPIATAILTYWNLTHPDKRAPGVYFLNPDIADKNLSGEALEKKFREEHPRLFKDKDKGIFVFDVCAHKGDTLKKADRVLTEAGFSDVSYGLEYDGRKDEDRENFPVVFDFTRGRKALLECFPFGYEQIMRKGDKLHADRPTDEYLYDRSIEVFEQIEAIKMFALDMSRIDRDKAENFLNEQLETIPKNDRRMYSLLINKGYFSTQENMEKATQMRKNLNAVVRKNFLMERRLTNRK